ncbi:ABC transporter ATP-binding protein [Anoxybacteroides tepidamans]|uniref:ABC transporter ATP-binding protein n=1 Tax=Anoxybacteroides tepidamans TaxID=265948 RepID=UPI000489248F|nr:ABC transporter ATP-binding protein [Anoxybacillus tepidamans]
MKKQMQEEKADWRSFIAMIRATKPPKVIMTTALLLSLISSLANLAIPMFTKKLTDGFTISSLSKTTIVLLVGAFIVQTLASGFSIYLMNYTGEMIVSRLREQVWKKLLSLTVSYYDHHRTGETASRVTNDTSVIKGLITEHMANFLNGVISIIGSIALLLYLDWKMTLVMFVVLPLTISVMRPLGRQMFKNAKRLQDEMAQFTAFITQVLSEIRLVKLSNAEPSEYENGKRGIANLFHYGLKEAKVQAMIMPLMRIIMMVLLVVILGFGGYRVSTGAMTAGGLVAYILYLFQMVMPLAAFSTFFTQLQKAMGATHRIIATLSEQEEDYVSGNEVKRAPVPIHVKNLHFSYGEEPVLRNLNFTIEPGKVTAIVGPSGSGKTTFFSLLERYYEPTDGMITLGNEPLRSFSLAAWRQQIGYVSQESPLIAGTIRDNICYGLERDVSDEELKWAADMAYASSFIEELPQKYDTEVGERGIKLSGGQRQRIAIARALLRNPRILLLDEATSNLDSQSEMAVQQALQNLMKGRTTIVIAHRLSTVVNADQIIFLEKGEITGIGTHQELFDNHPLYREFATQQLHISEEMLKNVVKG